MKILIVRRDNIGDLILTTPVLAALRQHFPAASLEVLANSYNAPVLEGHPDVDVVHVYAKRKHREGGAGAEWAALLRTWLALRESEFDYVLLAAPGFHARQVRLARSLRARHLAAFVDPGKGVRGIDLPVDEITPRGHHVEATFRILRALGIGGEPPALRLGIGHAPAARPASALRVGLHISARRPSNRWHESHHVRFMQLLHERAGAQFRLFWSPGSSDDPRHPGDDRMAERIASQARALPMEAFSTPTIAALARGIGECDTFVCSDGGAMHLAAALSKPILCFFGDSPAEEWHPWRVPYRLLQPPSRDVRDISVEAALEAFGGLRALPRAVA